MSAGGPIDSLIDNATETDPDDRHALEAEVLATVWRYGMAADALWKAFISANWQKPLHADLVNVLKEHAKRPKADPFTIETVLTESGFNLLEGDKQQLRAILSEGAAVEPEDAIFRLDRMKETDKQQEILNLLTKATTAAKKGDSTGALSIVLKGANEKKIVHEYETEDKAAAGLLEHLTTRRNDGRAFLGLDSGFRHMNEVFNGLTAGLFILAGAPSTGKTTLAKQIADHVAEKEKTPVLFWSFEQSREELQIKSLSRMANVNSREIQKGRTVNEDWKKVTKANTDYLEGSGRFLTIIEGDRKDNLDRIRTAAQMAQYKAGGKGKPVLVIIDYLQIIPALPDTPDNKREQIDANLTELRRLARDLNSPVLVLSSMNRASYKNSPTLASLKESGGIEYSADAVLILHRTKSDQLTSDRGGRITLGVNGYILKNRNGELAKTLMEFTPAWSLFEETGKEDLDWNDAMGKP